MIDQLAAELSNDCKVVYQSDTFRHGHLKNAVLAHWWPQAKFTYGVQEYVRELTQAGFHVIIVSTSPGDFPDMPQGIADLPILLLQRPNVGHDFGSWCNALRKLPYLFESDQLLINNDSIVGPFSSLSPMFEKLAELNSDVKGITLSHEFGSGHLQSFFLLHEKSSLNASEVRTFWLEIENLRRKNSIVKNYEIGYADVLDGAGLTFEAVVDGARIGEAFRNPTIFGWKDLLLYDIPFVKRELLWKPGLAPNFYEIPDFVEQHFEQDVWNFIDAGVEDQTEFYEKGFLTQLAVMHMYRSSTGCFANAFSRASQQERDSLLATDGAIGSFGQTLSNMWIDNFSPTFSKRLQRSVLVTKRRLRILMTDPARALEKFKYVMRRKFA